MLYKNLISKNAAAVVVKSADQISQYKLIFDFSKYSFSFNSKKLIK